MTISFIDFVYGSSGSPPSDPTATTLPCTAGGVGGLGVLNVQAGDLLVGFLKWETSNGGTVGISSVSGAPPNAFSMGSLVFNTTVGDLWTMSGWVLAAAADPAATFQGTFSSGVNYRRIAIAQFRGEVGKTFSMVTSASGFGAASTTLQTSSFSAGQADQLLIMGTGLYGSTSYSTTTFGGVAATQPVGSPIDNTLVSYLMSGSVSSIIAECTTAAGFEWNIQADVFSLDAAPPPPSDVVYSIPNSFFFGANQ